MKFVALIKTYFGATTAPMDDVRRTLWNSSVDPGAYRDDGVQYQNAILEQYKIFTEMADRVSARRSLTNTFFLTLNTAVFAVFGSFWTHRPAGSPWWLAFPLLSLVTQCGAWFFLIRSYRQLNTAKYLVVGALEERLPAAPYWRAEWTALGQGKDPARYWPLTHLEQWIPVLFALLYVAQFVAVVVS